MRGPAVSLLLVLFVIEIFGGIIENRDELTARGNTEEFANFAQLPFEKIEENQAAGNSPLLSDTNDHDHSHHSTAEKHKRCPTYRVGSALKSRSGIVGAELPQSLTRRDLQSQLYSKMCTTCMSRHACNAVSECPLCEKWCTKLPPPANEDNLIDGPIVSPNLAEPVVSMSSRSNFGDAPETNVYAVAAWRSGIAKDAILKMAGVAADADVDAVVVLVTTRSNGPPLLADGRRAEPVLDVRNLLENVANQQQQIEPITGEANPESFQLVNAPIPAGSEILPRYPIESDANIVHQSMNPDIIEGPPSMAAMDGETEQLASSVPENVGQTGSAPALGDSSVASANPSLERNQGISPIQEAPTNFLLRENTQPSFRTVDESRPASGNQATDAETGYPPASPGARMREFLESVKANRASSKNAILSRKSQIENAAPNLQNKAREAMERFKAIQIPRSFQRFNAPDGNEDGQVIGANEAGRPQGVGATKDFAGDDEDISRTSHGNSHGHGHGSNHGNGHGNSHGNSHGHGHGHHHRASEQDELIDSQGAANDVTGNFDDGNQLAQGFVKLDERRDMANLASENIDPTRMMDVSEDGNNVNTQSRSQQTQDYPPAGPQEALNPERSLSDAPSTGLGARNENPDGYGAPGVNEVTGSENPDLLYGPPGANEEKKAAGAGVGKLKLGARTNELLQKIKEKQDARKQTYEGVKKALSAVIEDAKPPTINDVSKTDTALGAIQEAAKKLQPGTGPEAISSKNTPPNPSEPLSIVPKRISQAVDVPKSILDQIQENERTYPSEVVVGSQPLQDSFERIQPYMSRSGRPWHNHVSALDASDKPFQEPSLGSRIGESEDTPVSNALGAISPGDKEMDISFQKPSEIYFSGRGINLPLLMMKKPDGAIHFSVDLEKLCACNNASCPRNHSEIEKTVETILEKEAELKDQLVNEAKGFASGREQPTLGQQFENMSPAREESFHRDQRDTVQKFLEMKDRIAGRFDSGELQSDGAEILKRSPAEKATKKLEIVEATTKPVLQEPKPQAKNVKDTAKALHDTEENVSSRKVTKDAVAPNYFEDFLGKTLNEFKSRMSDLEKKNQELSKTLGLPQNLLKHFWNAGAMEATADQRNLGSRIQDVFDRSVKKDHELYDNLASIAKPYKFKNLEKKMESAVKQYAKKDDKMVSEEAAALQSMNEDPVIKKEVGIASNVLKFFKDLATDKGR